MRDLLDTSSLRRLKLIECMLDDNRWWKTGEIADQLLCSESTVKSDINYFRLSYSGVFNFETSKQKGIRLTTTSSFQMDNFYQEIMRGCLNVQFVNLLFFEKLYTLEEYADALYTSVSSVKRIIEHVRVTLKKYELTIQQKPIRIKGNEKQILLFYGVLFWEEYGSSFLNMDHTYKIESLEFVTKFKDNMNLSLSPSIVNKMTSWLILFCERLSQGHHVEKGYTPLLPTSKKVTEFSSKQLLLLPFDVKSEDIKFVSYFLENRYLYFDKEVIKSNPDLLKIHSDIGMFLETLSEKMSVILVNKDMVQKRLFSEFIYKLEFKGLHYSLVERSKIVIFNNDGIYDCFLENTMNILYSLDRTPWIEMVLADSVDFFYLLISTWENLTTEILTQRKKINALVVSQFGIYHEKYLKELINIRFPYKLNYFLITQEDFPNDIDLIITDHEVKEIKCQFGNHIPVIGISYSPSKYDFDKLSDKIETMFLQKYTGTIEPNE